MYSLPIIVYLAAALVVTKIPYVSTYLSICFTLLYEVTKSLIGSEENKKIRLLKSKLESDIPITFKHDFLSYVGYTAASLAAIGLFYLISTHNYHMIFYLLIILIAFSILFWIRHFLEFLWALSFIALLALPIYFGYERVIQHGAIFLASYILVQSILNAFSLLRETFTNRKSKGMAGKVKEIPSMILGIALAGQSLYAGYFIFVHLIRTIHLPWT